MTQQQKKGTSNRGFASMDQAKQREIASKGGHAAHQKGTAHRFTSEEAREAGRKGGHASHQKAAAMKAAQERNKRADDDEEQTDKPYKGADNEFSREESRKVDQDEDNLVGNSN